MLKKYIIEQICNLKDNNNKSNSYTYEFDYINKRNEKQRIRNNDKSQYFCHTTYKCLPHTLKRYKLFVISSFDFIEKNIFICAICLIPNEKQITYENIFDKLKNFYYFKPLIITSDFYRSITNAIKKINQKQFK